MASVSDVTLQIGPSSTASDKLAVSVGYTLTFSAAEVGQQYKLAFKLFSQDASGDEEGMHPLAPLTDFMFSQQSVIPGLFVSVPHKRITATAGTHTLVETQEVARSILNEDPGFTMSVPPKTIPPTLPFPLPNPDEIFARVVLIASQAQSKVLTVTA